MNLRPRVLLATDRMQSVAMVALVFGSAVCFGGAIWWFRPAVAVLVIDSGRRQAHAALVNWARAGFPEPAFVALADGALGGLVAARPVTPFPRAQALAGRSADLFPRLPACAGPERLALRSARSNRSVTRSPATLDRAATLRWLVGAAACLGIFWAVGHFADRLGRLYLVWGCVVAAFVLNAGSRFGADRGPG